MISVLIRTGVFILGSFLLLMTLGDGTALVLIWLGLVVLIAVPGYAYRAWRHRYHRVDGEQGVDLFETGKKCGAVIRRIRTDAEGNVSRWSSGDTDPFDAPDAASSNMNDSGTKRFELQNSSTLLAAREFDAQWRESPRPNCLLITPFRVCTPFILMFGGAALLQNEGPLFVMRMVVYVALFLGVVQFLFPILLYRSAASRGEMAASITLALAAPIAFWLLSLVAWAIGMAAG